MKKQLDRRNFIRNAGLGSAAMFAAMPAFAGGGRIIEETLAASPERAPEYKIKFSVCGINHAHIYGMIGAVQRGGGELVSFFAKEPDLAAGFAKRYPGVKQAASEAEILNDPSTQLVLTSTIANERAPLGVRAMEHGKDFLSDKPGITTLEQLAEVRRTVARTKRIYGIMYSERLEVKAAVHAGDLVQQGAIGKVIQTINIAPHQVNPDSRPEWFWHKKQYGGILTDIGSHQVDQFLFYTGSRQADVVSSQVGNFNHPDKPDFEDFGDCMLRGDHGLGYVRLDWYTPKGLGTWGDGRLFILGTEGYIELRKYIDIAGRKGGNHLFIVDGKETRYIDCNNLALPFGPQFVSDIVNRTHTAQDQEQCLLAAELVLKAQKNAKMVTLKG